jgi:hypothetical protein
MVVPLLLWRIFDKITAGSQRTLLVLLRSESER